MKKTKRLFLFAGYDKDGIIDDTLVHYLTELSKLGDIVLVMDCDVADTTKLSGIKNILHTELARHNEYDFGSYKRGYIWAHDNKILEKYDWVYLVNDSVYGPLYSLDNVLNTLEQDSEVVGMIDVFDTDILPRHIQSWFIGLKENIATSKP
ncbi:MAG: rhamnan synthesis F family protein, partial [Alphaproteobacteria bacterium]